MKAIRSKFRAAIDSGRKSGHGRVALLFFDICQDIWGGLPSTTTLASGNETAEISQERELQVSMSCEVLPAPAPVVLIPVYQIPLPPCPLHHHRDHPVVLRNRVLSLNQKQKQGTPGQ